MKTNADVPELVRWLPTRMNTAALVLSLLLAVVESSVCLQAQTPPDIAITNSVLLTWPQPAEPCIVVGADSLTSPIWKPWPEPIFSRFGQLGLAVPTTQAGQYFKLVAGSQLIDDFSAPPWPSTSRGQWMAYFVSGEDASRIAVTRENGALRVRTTAPPVDGRFLLMPPQPDMMVRDFVASVDILRWPAAGREFGFLVRGMVTHAGGGVDFNSSNGYIGSASRERGCLLFWDGGQELEGPAFTIEPTASYRLVFSGVGDQLSLRFVNLKSGVTLEKTWTDNRWSEGPVAIMGDALAGASMDITVDNVFVTGTKP